MANVMKNVPVVHRWHQRFSPQISTVLLYCFKSAPGQVILLCSFLLVYPAPASARKIPMLTGELVDEARLLSPTETQTVTEEIRRFNSTGKGQLAVLIVSHLDGQDIETFSISVVEKWRLGEKKKGNGILFLIAPNERRMRIEVGYGLEGDLPDIYAKRILDDTVAAFFKERRYSDGIQAGILEIARYLAEDIPSPEKRKGPRAETIPFLFFFIILFFSLFALLFRPWRYRYGGWHSGGWNSYGSRGMSGGWGGGGGFRGGGGGFGGGGASSSW